MTLSYEEKKVDIQPALICCELWGLWLCWVRAELQYFDSLTAVLYWALPGMGADL